jgi:hypothetical protein
MSPEPVDNPRTKVGPVLRVGHSNGSVIISSQSNYQVKHTFEFDFSDRSGREVVGPVLRPTRSYDPSYTRPVDNRPQDHPGWLDGRPHPLPADPYWRHLRYAAWQESNAHRAELAAGRLVRPGRPITSLSPQRLAELCKEAPRDYAAIAAARKAKKAA